MQKVLIVAYLFPPAGGGAVTRVHSFVKYLPQYDWLPVVLTVDQGYYPQFLTDDTLLDSYDQRVSIRRTRSLEPSGGLAKSLQASVYGTRQTSPLFQRLIKPCLRSLHRVTTFPDDQILWLPSAIATGLRLIRDDSIDAIVATTPPHSSGIVGLVLSRLGGRPLVLDVRDDWVGNPLFDNGIWHRRALARFTESKIISVAKRVVGVTPESLQLFRAKYPRESEGKFVLIPNGYDREDVEQVRKCETNRHTSQLYITYAGGLPSKRNPAQLFQALAELRQELGGEPPVHLDFYGYAHQEFQKLAQTEGVEGLVSFHGFVPKHESLERVAESDAALVLIPESEGSRTAIPGKIYEYMALRKFVLALCPKGSATACLVESHCLGIVASMTDTQEIKQALKTMLEMHKIGGLARDLPSEMLARYERSAHAWQLAEILSSVTSGAS